LNKVAIVADSVACLPKELVEEYGIRVVPAANIFINGKIYRDWLDISPAQAYEELEKAPGRFSTSAISPESFADAFRELSPHTKNILCITLASELSAVHDVAKLARESVRERLPETRIEVMDSRTAAAAEGLVVLAAARAAAEGKDLAAVMEAAEHVAGRVHVVGLLETVRYVYRTGRVPKVAAWVASALRIKPIFTISGGKARSVAIVRSKQRGLDRLIEIMRKKVGTAPVRVAVMYASGPQEALALKEVVSANFNCVEIFVMEFSPVMAYSTGPGVVGLAFYAED
jgi:DegV family protein with EDD domain